MPFCGTQPVPPGTQRCSDGSTPTARPMGGASQPQGESTIPQSSGNYGWNQDTRPVTVGRRPLTQTDYIPGVERITTGPNVLKVADARDMFNEYRGQGTARGASDEDRNRWSGLLDAMRRYTGQELGTRGSQEDAWASILDDAASAGVDVWDLLSGRAGGSGSRGSGSGGSGYSGPRTTTSNALMDSQSAEMLLNDLATDMLGRSLTPAELEKYTKRFRSMEQKNPTVTTTSQTSSIAEQGMDDKDIARKILESDPTFADQVIRTDVLDMFLSRVDGKMGVNG